MYDLIHNLPIPTTIATFDGEVIDVNQSCLEYCKATTKTQFLNYDINEFLVDKSMHNSVLDTLLSGKSIKDQKTLIKFFDNTVNVVSSNVSLLCPDKKLILIQNQLLRTSNFYFVEKYEVLLLELKKLNPFLNKAGQLELARIFMDSKSVIDSTKDVIGIDNLVHKLGASFPRLSSSELQICALLGQGFSPKEILQLSGISPNNLRVLVFRICQKLNIGTRSELIHLLSSFTK